MNKPGENNHPRPKLLFITRKWPPAIGGMETYSFKLAQGASELMDVETFKLPGKDNGLPPSLPRLFMFGVGSSMKLLFKPLKPDFIHGGDLSLWPLIWLAGCRNRKSKNSIAVHGSDISFAFRTGAKAKLYKSYLKIGRRLLSKTQIIANSAATAELLAKMGFSNLRTLPLRIRGPEEPITTADHNGPSYLLYVGRVTKAKGLPWFIDQVLPLLSEDLEVKIAGPVIGKNINLKNQKRIEYLGPVIGKDLTRLRRNALAVILPNIDQGIKSFEGFGLSATEAAADGAIVIASDHYGLRDAISNNETGFLLTPSDVEIWAEKVSEIQKWNSEKHTAFSKKIRANILLWPDWAEYVKNLFKV